MLQNQVRIIVSSVSLALICAAAAAQQTAATPAEQGEQLVESFLTFSSRPPAKVLLLGTFHFRDSGRDDFKPEHEVDVLSEERQAEIEAIVQSLARFQPTKVAVEATADRQEDLDAQFDAYAAGRWALPAKELYQLGFRLAKAAGHGKVYAIDAPGRWYEPRENPSDYARDHGQGRYLMDPFALGYDRLSTHLDELKVKTTLRRHLLLLNSEPMIRAQHGRYVRQSLAIGDSEHYPGVDGFVSQWFNRNLRIFANLLRITNPREEERIVVIFGAGHVPILRHSVDASPALELVEVDEYL